MPLTFIDIERRKRWRIAAFFLVLLALYSIACLAIAAPLAPAVFLRSGTSGRLWPGILSVAVILSAGHIFLAGFDSAGTVVRTLGGQRPDPEDSVHRVLLNIMDEIQVVTGHRKKIDCIVIPSLSLNALAAADFRGRAVIGITEGLLSRLNRQQLESVIAHEAHHILSGDCLETTVAANLFSGLSSLIDRYEESGRGHFVHPVLWPAWLLVKLGSLLNLFISREREYRADAAAVRMTRDPLALAETLQLLSRSWRGAGYIGSGFEMICIVNPEATALDESEGFWADLLSTHPPLEKRIDLLLAMAHAGPALPLPARREANEQAEPARYYALDPRRQWQGPFTLSDLAGLPWLSPLTWMHADDGQRPDRAWKRPAINAIFSRRLADGGQAASDFLCPACGQRLVAETYEGTQICSCRFCGGSLVENGRIARILARTGREQPCTERIRSLGQAVASGNQAKSAQRHAAGMHPVPLLSCPGCGHPMSRVFFSAAYLIEVDRCLSCAVTWFDENELAMVQCLIEAHHEPAGAQERSPA